MAEKSLRKTRKGKVVSKSGNKSIVVLVETRRQHPRYKKVVTYSKKFHVHDEKNIAVVGDKVEIIECRPVSRLKKWRLQTVS
jgi:small subunit ribosomal protein S17